MREDKQCHSPCQTGASGASLEPDNEGLVLVILLSLGTPIHNGPFIKCIEWDIHNKQDDEIDMKGDRGIASSHIPPEHVLAHGLVDVHWTHWEAPHPL